MNLFLLLLLGMFTGFIIGRLWVYVTCHLLNWNGKQKVKGYHYHHTLLAIVPIIGLYFVRNNLEQSTFLVGTILGVIIEHRVMYGGFYLITKIDKDNN